ncbi:hypothetical protein [Streptomyces sp. NPDC059649]|uniref:hypothetical protein n=1 Tax=Streptomyces sp. NPDC059649 TaxID=3346895 RepID=UPI0036C213DF
MVNIEGQQVKSFGEKDSDISHISVAVRHDVITNNVKLDKEAPKAIWVANAVRTNPYQVVSEHFGSHQKPLQVRPVVRIIPPHAGVQSCGLRKYALGQPCAASSTHFRI